MTTHGTLTDYSVSQSLNTPIGKGREGNRKGKGSGNVCSLSLTHPPHPAATRKGQEC